LSLFFNPYLPLMKNDGYYCINLSRLPDSLTLPDSLALIRDVPFYEKGEKTFNIPSKTGY